MPTIAKHNEVITVMFIVIGSLIAGMMVDRFGRKPLLLAAAALYSLAGASGYVLDSLFHILLGRAFLGFACRHLAKFSIPPNVRIRWTTILFLSG